MKKRIFALILVFVIYGLIYQSIVVAAPPITVTPDCGLPGDSITILGSGFDAFDTVIIEFDSIFLRSLTTNSTGGFVDINTVPLVADGIYIINASSTDIFGITIFSVPCVADSDGDSFPDNIDNCPFVPNDQSDSDQICTEEFGIPVCVNFPDGVGDACDNCLSEVNANQDDADSDLIGDVCDNCAQNYNPGQEDSDSDNIGNVCDICPNDIANDFDSDGVCGNIDNCPYTPNAPEFPFFPQADCDSDGIGDACDFDSPCSTDFDGDSIPDLFDNCPSVSNFNQFDSDLDGVGNVCDNCNSTSNSDQADSDADLVGDVCDNCAVLYNNNQNDVNNDGVGDACDCFDVLQGPNEVDIDNGLICPYVPCTWCPLNVDPVRIRDSPTGTGQIDIVFIPHESFSGNLSGFNAEVIQIIRNFYFKMDQMIGVDIFGVSASVAGGSLPSNYKDRFNFYIYNGGFTELDSGGCAGNLPSGYHNDVPWADSHATLVSPTAGFMAGCSFSGPPSKWAASTKGGIDTDGDNLPDSFPTNIIALHETMHSIFSLVDEYCSRSTSYHEENIFPNVWREMDRCITDITANGFTLGNCREIQTASCNLLQDWFRYDVGSSSSPDIMTACAGGCNRNFTFWEADLKRINYVFSNWPSELSKGILVEFNINNNQITELDSRVVSSHPDVGLQKSDFIAELLSPADEIIMEYGISDPRHQYQIIVEEGEVNDIPSFVDNVNFTLIFPWEVNLRKLNILDGITNESVAIVDFAEPLLDFCGNIHYADIDCSVLDLDNDNVLDKDDKCPGTTNEQPYEPVVYGCSCKQILDIKPGEDKGEMKNGCSKGTIRVFTNQTGWARN